MKIGSNPKEPYICFKDKAWLKYNASDACPSIKRAAVDAPPIMMGINPSLTVGIVLKSKMSTPQHKRKLESFCTIRSNQAQPTNSWIIDATC